MSIDTTPAPTPAAQIAARGVPIKLYDGSTVRLRYSMLSMELMEQRFGNMARIQTTVQNAVDALQAVHKAAHGIELDERERKLADDSSLGDVFSKITALLLPGLVDARAVDPRQPELGPQFLEGPQGEQIAKRVLEPSELQNYMQAFRAAFVEAFPAAPAAQPQAGGAVPPPLPPLAQLPVPQTQMPQASSPGATSTTPPAASPDARTTFSGA